MPYLNDLLILHAEHKNINKFSNNISKKMKSPQKIKLKELQPIIPLISINLPNKFKKGGEAILLDLKINQK